jgi:TATA-binding protein-associated factor
MSSRSARCFRLSFNLIKKLLTVRLDRLLLLLDTGSTASVRTTAAKQLAQLAAKSVISDVALEDDVKAHRHHQPLGDPSGWTELMAVIARVRESRGIHVPF